MGSLFSSTKNQENVEMALSKVKQIVSSNPVVVFRFHMGSLFSSTKNQENVEMALSKVKQIVSSNPVVVFSKTHCGYCKRVKQLLSELGATYRVVELDEESDGSEMQSALAEWTNQRTVPNVFVAGKHIGSCDMVTGKHQLGELVPLLNEAGAVSNKSAQLQI